MRWTSDLCCKSVLGQSITNASASRNGLQMEHCKRYLSLTLLLDSNTWFST
uniref:Uncharacterized protein n=1 Tax=Manihot esculenta TaxID=3983 RepID=A0A2C9VKM0_MANES